MVAADAPVRAAMARRLKAVVSCGLVELADSIEGFGWVRPAGVGADGLFGSRDRDQEGLTALKIVRQHA